ncbi:hypothetical protein M2323_001779 [Rhodoblastus acidophilus]|uniref:hypothetical protein n=1 Tax=Rhodoblastus acidophilus TaxID=1074 RepID=UPI002225B0F3|nr:hypothetical protein [Rhodoblastus acidophilus]MCW2283789.1 hypothetical protein [Rhodoblastus acidophilus]MCW2332862.1 hypothetical protein [Rhodoblastus acidophilus]
MNNLKYLRRKQAGEYLKSKYGFGAAKTLAKLAVVGGGPEICYAGSRTPLYRLDALDAWASGRISGPVRNTSERDAAPEASE